MPGGSVGKAGAGEGAGPGAEAGAGAGTGVQNKGLVQIEELVPNLLGLS